MTRLTKKKGKSECTEACEKIFQELTNSLTSATMLTLPNYGENYTFYCDESRVYLGRVLMQGGKMIAYAYKQLKVH